MRYLLVYAKGTNDFEAFLAINLKVCEFIERGYNPVGKLKRLEVKEGIVYYQPMYMRYKN